MKTNEINYKNYKIEIHSDEICESADIWENDDCFLIYDHRDFFVERNGFNPNDIFETMQNGKKLYNGYWFFPVYAYIHSGVSLQLKRWFSCVPQGHNEFDVSFKGFALVKRQKGWSYSSKQAYKIAESVLNEWNDYLSGNVYGFMTKDKDDNDIDSCWGFYGDPEKSGLMEEAKNSIDCDIKYKLQNRIKQIKTWIKHHVPLKKRYELSI